MRNNSVITLAQEVVRLCKNHFNNAEPPAIVTVTKVYTNSADVKYSFVDPETGETQNIIDRKVPILKPCYTGSSLNLKAGDEVMLVYNGGNAANAYIIGKL